MADLFLFRSPVGHIILIQDSQRTYKSDFCQTDTYPHTRTYISLKSPVGVHRTYAYTEVSLGTTKLILILRSLHLFGGTRRYYRDMMERILVLRNLFLYGSTRKYYKTYTSTSYLILVLQRISWSYKTYTCITELILVFKILYLYYRTYTCISDLILVLQNLYMYFGFYTCLTKHIHVFRILYLSYEAYTYLTDLILVLQILFLCEGTRRYDKSKQIRIISPIRSDQTYADTNISP